MKMKGLFVFSLAVLLGLVSTEQAVTGNNDVHKNKIDIEEAKTLYFNGQALTGENVKEALAHVNSTDLASTTRLMLSDNLISEFPPLTFPVELEYSLNQLWMEDNPLGYLRPSTSFEITRLGSLKLLSLSNTSLRSLEPLTLPQLEVLYLKHNFLTDIPQRFNNLRQLHLTNNRISAVVPQDLASFTKLELLDLSSNWIDFIFDHPFMSLKRLQTLYLNNNTLYTVSDVDVPRNGILFLGSNPLGCSCALAELVSRQGPFVVDKENIKCTDDNGHSYKSVTSVGLAPCRDPWRWWYMAGEKLEHFFRWFRDAGVTWHNVCNFLFWALFVTVFYAAVKVIRSKKSKKPSTVHYTILDGKGASEKIVT